MGSIQRYLLRVITLWPSRVVCQEDSKISQTFSFCFFSFFFESLDFCYDNQVGFPR